MKRITPLGTADTNGTAKKISTQRLVLIALMTAVTCILAPFSIPIPISPVPISLTNLVLLVSIYILGWKDAVISFLIYLLLGTAGHVERESARFVSAYLCFGQSHEQVADVGENT
ncbi:MAG: biotin transporter BioY, partial [Dorea sp.]|nr:biotin transporter BioY [Dorea sp.]